MIKRVSLPLIIIVAAVGLTGCATNADVGNMSYEYHGAQKIHNAALIRNISVGKVTGGHETNPLWTSQINNINFKRALEESLSSSHLFAHNEGKYQLNAELIQLKQPLLGFNLTVDCVVHYKLYKQGFSKAIYDRNISSSYTANFGDAVLATERLKKANEGAARLNIKNLIDDLYHLPV